MRKSVTPIITIVLLSLMTVSAVGVAFFWTSNVQSSMQESVGASVGSSPGGDCSRLNIVSVRGDSVSVSNVGCDTVENVSVVVDGVLTEYEVGLGPGQATTISLVESMSRGESHCVSVVLPSGVKSTECMSAGQATEEAGYFNSSESDGCEIVDFSGDNAPPVITPLAEIARCHYTCRDTPKQYLYLKVEVEDDVLIKEVIVEYFQSSSCDTGGNNITMNKDFGENDYEIWFYPSGTRMCTRVYAIDYANNTEIYDFGTSPDLGLWSCDCGYSDSPPTFSGYDIMPSSQCIYNTTGEFYIGAEINPASGTIRIAANFYSPSKSKSSHEEVVLLNNTVDYLFETDYLPTQPGNYEVYITATTSHSVLPYTTEQFLGEVKVNNTGI